MTLFICLFLTKLKCFWELYKDVEQGAINATRLTTSYRFNHKNAVLVQNVLEPQRLKSERPYYGDTTKLLS